MIKIPFNKPSLVGSEYKFIEQSLNSGHISGDGEFTKKCHDWFKEHLDGSKTLLTTSCTHALEMAALLINIQSGDEVIMPSFTFVSTANAFVLRGAIIKFVDIRPDTMNINEQLIEDAITSKTKAIVPVHYAGVACEMDKIMELANKHNLIVIEDAAQAMTASYKGKKLGTIGHFGTYSFHETKNFTSAGEGGLLIINDDSYVDNAEIIREKGTNRSQFFRGMVDKYSWVDVGSSYLMNDVSAAYLWGQLLSCKQILQERLNCWQYYHQNLTSLSSKGLIEIPQISSHCQHNAHIFYIKVKNLETRSRLISKLKNNHILAVFHYVPLHSSIAGKKFGEMVTPDIYTTKESERLLRLPLFFGLTKSEQDEVIQVIEDFYA